MTEVRERADTAQTQMNDGDNTGRELAPVRQQRLTVAQEREHGRAKLIHAVESRQAEISAFLKPFNVSWDFFLSCLRVAMMKTLKDDGEFFSVVTPASFLEAVLRCAMNGLLPDGKEAAIARFKDTATFMPMRDGFVKTLHRTGMVKDINDGLVTAREEELGRFEYEEGSTGYIKHRLMLDRDETKDTIVAAYCVVRTVNGGEYREVVTKADLAKIAKVSRATKGPRIDWSWRMHQKAPLRRIVLKLPKDEALSRLLAHDDDNYDLTLLAVPEREVAIPKARLFDNKAHIRAKPALEAPAAPEGPALDGQVAGEAAQVPETTPEAQRLVTALLHCEDLATLIDLIHESKGVECSTEEREWLTETADAARQRLMPRAEDFEEAEISGVDEGRPGGDQTAEVTMERQEDGTMRVTDVKMIEPFRLLAIISSVTGLRPYEDAALWRGDLLNKLNTAKGETLTAFWAKNLEHVLAAREHHPEDAERVLQVAAVKGLKTEVSA